MKAAIPGELQLARDGAEQAPNYLIHTNNSPNPVTMRVSGRLRVSIRDDAGIPLAQVFEVIQGRLSPLEFLAIRRAADGFKAPT